MSCQCESADGDADADSDTDSDVDGDGDAASACGNNLYQLEMEEACDGDDLGEASCESLGHTGGELGCTDDCQLDETSCFDCSNGVIETGEECEPDQIGTCESLGYSGGELQCTETCQNDESTCFDCGDGDCEPIRGEDRTNCSEDCAWIAVSAGGSYTCAIMADTTLWCWGSNSHGELGLGDTTNYSTPQRIPGLKGATTVASAGSCHNCAVMDEGAVWCWGCNLWGRLGIGDRDEEILLPSRTHLTSNAVAISAGAGHTCGLDTEGNVWCWGFNSSGQVGDGTTEHVYEPVQVPGLTGASFLATGGYYTSSIIDRTSTYWGDNWWGSSGSAGALSPSSQQLSMSSARSFGSEAAMTIAALSPAQKGSSGARVEAMKVSSATPPARASPVLPKSLESKAPWLSPGDGGIAVPCSKKVKSPAGAKTTSDSSVMVRGLIAPLPRSFPASPT